MFFKAQYIQVFCLSCSSVLPAQPVTSIHSPGGGLLDEIRQARCSVQCLHRTLSCFDRGAELETEDLTLLKISLPLREGQFAVSFLLSVLFGFQGKFGLETLQLVHFSGVQVRCV